MMDSRGPFTPGGALLLSLIGSKLQILRPENVNIELLRVNLGEIFYEFWIGDGLLRELLDTENKDRLMRLLVEIQIHFEHLAGHIAEANEGLNRITKMVPKPGRPRESRSKRR